MANRILALRPHPIALCGGELIALGLGCPDCNEVAFQGVASGVSDLWLFIIGTDDGVPNTKRPAARKGAASA